MLTVSQLTRYGEWGDGMTRPYEHYTNDELTFFLEIANNNIAKYREDDDQIMMNAAMIGLQNVEDEIAYRKEKA